MSSSFISFAFGLLLQKRLTEQNLHQTSLNKSESNLKSQAFQKSWQASVILFHKWQQTLCDASVVISAKQQQRYSALANNWDYDLFSHQNNQTLEVEKLRMNSWISHLNDPICLLNFSTELSNGHLKW